MEVTVRRTSVALAVVLVNVILKEVWKRNGEDNSEVMSTGNLLKSWRRN